jgi:hypothetical protein
MSGNMDCAETRHEIVSSVGAGNVGATAKLANRLDKRLIVDLSLPLSEILGRPFVNICEIELCQSAETNPPFPHGHGDYWAEPEVIFFERSRK